MRVPWRRRQRFDAADVEVTSVSLDNVQLGVLIAADRYRRDPISTLETEIEHLDGVPWYDAPLPSREHTCWPQTRGWSGFFTRIDRCACGATWIDGGWTGRDERRRD
jgi:hypothetical protein